MSSEMNTCSLFPGQIYMCVSLTLPGENKGRPQVDSPARPTFAAFATARASSSVSNLQLRDRWGWSEESTDVMVKHLLKLMNLLTGSVRVQTHLRTGTSGPKVSSLVHSMSVVTSASSVGSTKEPSRRFPPFTTFAPRDTASDTCWSTCRPDQPIRSWFVQTRPAAGQTCGHTWSGARLPCRQPGR